MNERRSVSRSDPLVKRLLALTFPHYRGRKIFVARYTGPQQFELYWSDGSRDQVKLIDARGIADLRVIGAPWHNRAAFAPIDQPPGSILAVHSIFLGRDTGVTFYIRPLEQGQLPADLAQLLAA